MTKLTLETDRLLLRPLGDDEMAAFIEKEKDPDLRQAYNEMLQGCLRDPENRIWSALWLMELKNSPGTVVGDFCFKGLPPDGAVELGYGLREGFCGKGYMTEAVRTICRWALARPGVSRVEAETAPDNAPSRRVLDACGFVPTGAWGEEGPRFILTGTDPDRG